MFTVMLSLYRDPNGCPFEPQEGSEAALLSRFNESYQAEIDVVIPVNDTNDHVIPLQYSNTPVAHNNVDQADHIAPFVAAEAEIQALNDEQKEGDDDNLPGPKANHNMSNGTIFKGIYVPTTGTDRQRLIELYRNQIINDEVHDLANLHGLVNIATNANDLELIEMQDALHTNDHRVPQFRPHANDMRRHY